MATLYHQVLLNVLGMTLLCLLGSRPDLQSLNPVSELLPALGCDILSA